MAFSMKRCSSNGKCPSKGARELGHNSPAREEVRIEVRQTGIDLSLGSQIENGSPETPYWKAGVDGELCVTRAEAKARIATPGVLPDGQAVAKSPLASRGKCPCRDRNNCGMTSIAALMTKDVRSHAR